MRLLIASDLARAEAVIRSLRLKGPHDGPDAFTIPKDRASRLELADLIYDLADEWAARAILDLPPRARTVAFPRGGREGSGGSAG